MKYLKLFVLAVIVVGAFSGIRYLGVFIHDACTAPGEDCPPPLALLGELGYVLTGGPFDPLRNKN